MPARVISNPQEAGSSNNIRSTLASSSKRVPTVRRTKPVQASLSKEASSTSKKQVSSSIIARPKADKASASRTIERQNVQSSSQDHSSSDVLLKDLSKPFRCGLMQIQNLLSTLSISMDSINVKVLHPEWRMEMTQTMNNPEKEISERILIAKQVVNKVINTLNELITTSWKPEKLLKAERTNSTPVAASSSSRPSSVESMKKHASMSTSPIQASQKAKISGKDSNVTSDLNVSSTNVTALIDCFRIAIQFLLQEVPNDKIKEIEGIRLSVIRKVVALELYEVASFDLEMVRKSYFLSISQPQKESRQSFLLDDFLFKGLSDSNSVAALLDLQSLSFVTSIALAPRSQVAKILDNAVNHPNGPLRVQWRMRTDWKKKIDGKVIDRQAYTIEKAISRLSSSPVEGEKDDVIFKCRSASLTFLQSVSDLDLSAFWDRVARVGISHFRASADDEGKFKIFEEINNLFKFLNSEGEKYASVHGHAIPDISTNRGYKSFRDTWQHLARKAGSVCHRLTSEPLRAEKAYLEAIENLDDSIWREINVKAAQMPMCDLFQLDQLNENDGVRSPLQDTGRLIKVVFELQAYELLRFQKGEPTIFDTLSKMQGAAVQALPSILEMCLEMMEYTIHREEGPRAFEYILNRLLTFYDGTTMPLRRARVLLRQVERHLFYPSAEDAFDEAKVIMEEIEELVGMDTFASDGILMQYKSQYTATFHLLRAMLSMRQSRESESIVAQFESAVQLLSKTLAPKTEKENMKDTVAPNRILRKTSAPRQIKGREPKTPPPRPLEQKNYKAISTIVQIDDKQAKPAEQKNRVDNISRLLRLLEWAQGCDVWHGSAIVSIQINELGRRMARCFANRNESYLRFSSNLVAQYASLGQFKLAKLIVREAQNIEFQHDENWACFVLAEADLHSHLSHSKESMDLFDDGVDLLEHLEPVEKSSGLQGALQRISHTERQALAYRTFGRIHLAKGNLTAALKAAIDSVKLSMKSGTMLARLSAKKDEGEDIASPFLAQQQQQQALPTSQNDVFGSKHVMEKKGKSLKSQRFSSPLLATLHGRMVRALHESYILVSMIHCVRGSARDAEAFATECVEFDSHAQVPALHAFALLQRASLRLRMGQAQAATDDVESAVVLIDPQHDTVAHATLAFLQGDQHFKLQSFAEAMHQFDIGQKILQKIDATFEAEQMNSDEVLDAALPTLKALLIRRQAWLLHITGEEEGCSRLLESTKMSNHQQDAGELDVLRGKVAIQQALTSLKRDPQLDLLSEATISLPSVLKGLADRLDRKRSYLSPRKKEVGKTAFERLCHASNLFDRVIDQGKAIPSTALQEAQVQKTICTTLMATLTSSMESIQHVKRSDLVQAITLERELDEVMDSKLSGSKQLGNSRSNPSKDYPRFRCIDVSTPFKSNLKKSLHRHSTVKSKAISTDEDSSEGEQLDAPLKAHWRTLQDRRRAPLQSEQDLPAHWTVVSISFARERNCMLLTRKDGGQGGQNSLYSIPIDRQSRREGEEEEDTCSLDAILGQFREIIAESNEATHSAQNLQSLDARKAWWTKRRMLDVRMKELLFTVEKTWLGAFKSVLLESPPCSAEDKASLKSSLQAVFAKSCVSQTATSRKASKQESVGQDIEIDERMLDRFCALRASECTDEELEDLAHYVMDAYLCKGMPIAVDEVDMDVCITDIRSALESHRGNILQEENSKAVLNDHHLFLILDKDMCAIPWESMPCLRGKAICRVPSLDFLYDRLQMAPDGRFFIDAQKTRLSYVLNPSQELIRTQERFLPFLQKNVTPSASSVNSIPQTPLNRSQRPSLLDVVDLQNPTKPRWKGIVGRTPILDEFAHALETNDIMLYFGHGGAEQYIRTSRLRSLMRCAVTMLWGCSSGVLREMGEFERCGTPNNYMLAGCPALVGNLWDATDKELDGVSENVMKLFGLINNPKDQDDSNETPKGVSLARAVAQSRDACKLPYLTGAACVVYGMPVYYR